ncbi:hypothetical protein ACIRQP_25390 [Streptomyces sp. NPDC102274]|uniref:hypothetical protein n=1 Tax=Streptomyces sp. NPDC102274 TaxID=3366151 RepID=UPI003829ADF5
MPWIASGARLPVQPVRPETRDAALLDLVSGERLETVEIGPYGVRVLDRARTQRPDGLTG